MKNLFPKILIFSLFFLFVPLTVEAESGVPLILPRATWENTGDLKNLLDWYPGEEEKENSPPDYFSIDRIIVHDMGCDVRHPGCNDKKISPITTIQNIYRYHSVTRNWGDIGYHYIIDYWGNIYEGRYGGSGVRGAHTYYDRRCNNFNVGSTGILLMGNYENTELSEIMYRSLIRLVAWIASTNGLNPKELNYTSKIWHSPKKGSDCDISQGGFTSAYIGPVVVGHGDVEEGNSDPGLVDLKRVRQEAGRLLLIYKDYLYSVNGKPEIYSIKDGVVFLTKDSSKKVITLNKNQFYAFPSSSNKIYPDGTLIKSDTRDRVYYMEENKRRPIFSEELFNLSKFNWSDIILLPDRDLAVYSLGVPLTYSDGALIKSDGPEIYLVENGKRRHISSAILFNRMGHNWTDIIKISQAELLAHPLGEKALLTDGFLIKEAQLPPVYLVKNKKKHWIKTLQAFLNLGYKWEDVISLSSEEMSYYAVGSVIEAIEETEEAEEKVEKPDIRIGIYEAAPGKSIKIKANGTYEVYKNGILLANKKIGENIIIPYSILDFYKFIPASESVIFEIISYEDHPKWDLELNDNLFRGIIEIKYSPQSKKLWVINELSLEDYLKGVAEALNNDLAEYLKAFVIAARSYALFHVQNGGKISGEIFHLKNWVFDQLYKGYGFEKRAPNVAKAVEGTQGLVTTYSGKPIRGVYSSDSGGVTKSACEIFRGVFCENENYNYLKGGVKDPEGTIHNRAAMIASHGVGMSSAGARRLAELGKNFEEILKYYYLGIELEKVY